MRRIVAAAARTVIGSEASLARTPHGVQPAHATCHHQEMIGIATIAGGLGAAVIAVTVILAILLVIGHRYDDRYEEPDWWSDFEREFDEYVRDKTRG